MNNDSPVLSERFWSKVHVSKRSRCWPWLGARDSLGYGQCNVDGKITKAPRVAFFLRNGAWPVNACHHCDNPQCCNPDHIFNGTRSDNMRDMVKKGRHKTDRGENHGRAVLTNADVLAMRADYKEGVFSMEAMAKKYGCSFSTAWRVIRRKNWGHLP